MRRVNCLSAPRQLQLPGLEDEFEESLSQVTVSESEEAAEGANENSEAKGYNSEGNTVSEESEQGEVAKEPKNGRKKK